MRQPDEPISPEEVLYRRIYCEWITFDDGIPRASSVAFRDRKEHKLSVVVARETSLRRFLRGRPEDSVVSIVAKDVINLGLKIERDFDPEQPGHAVIVPTPNIGRAKKIAATAKWVKLRNPKSLFFKVRRWCRRTFQ
jgi:hypothetical protein